MNGAGCLSWAREKRDLSHVQRLVLYELTLRANGRRYCWPSIALLARDIEATERAVINSLRALEGRGLISKVTDPEERAQLLAAGGARGGTRANVYRVLRPADTDTENAEYSSPSERDSELSIEESTCKGEVSIGLRAVTLKSVHPSEGGIHEISSPLTLNSVPCEGELNIPEKVKEEDKRKSTKTYIRRVRAKPDLSPIPDDWWPDEKGIAFAKDRGVEPLEVAKFIAHHQSRSNTLKWDAAWRTWCMKSEEFRKRKNPDSRVPITRQEPEKVGFF